MNGRTTTAQDLLDQAQDIAYSFTRHSTPFARETVPGQDIEALTAALPSLHAAMQNSVKNASPTSLWGRREPTPTLRVMVRDFDQAIGALPSPFTAVAANPELLRFAQLMTAASDTAQGAVVDPNTLRATNGEHAAVTALAEHGRAYETLTVALAHRIRHGANPRSHRVNIATALHNVATGWGYARDMVTNPDDRRFLKAGIPGRNNTGPEQSFRQWLHPVADALGVSSDRIRGVPLTQRIAASTNGRAEDPRHTDPMVGLASSDAIRHICLSGATISQLAGLVSAEAGRQLLVSPDVAQKITHAQKDAVTAWRTAAQSWSPKVSLPGRASPDLRQATRLLHQDLGALATPGPGHRALIPELSTRRGLEETTALLREMGSGLARTANTYAHQIERAIDSGAVLIARHETIPTGGRRFGNPWQRLSPHDPETGPILDAAQDVAQAAFQASTAVQQLPSIAGTVRGHDTDRRPPGIRAASGAGLGFGEDNRPPGLRASANVRTRGRQGGRSGFGR